MKINSNFVRRLGWLVSGAVLLQTTTNPTVILLEYLQRIAAFLTLTTTQAFQYAFFPQGLQAWTFYGAQGR